MLNWFYMGFGLGLGLLSALLVVALGIGLVDAITHKVRWWRFRQERQQ